jgi:S1-C subfamily serine protease
MGLPEEQKARRSRSVVLALVIVILVLAAGTLYFVSTLGEQNASLHGTVSALSSTNSLLQAQLAALSGTTVTVTGGSGNSSAATIDAEEIYSLANASVVTLEGNVAVSTPGFFGTQTSVETVLGSGFVISYASSHYVVTNYHVVNSVTNETVTFSDGDAYPAKVVGTDPYSDLAIVSVPAAPSSEFHSLNLISSSGVLVGQPVVVIGNPYGLAGSMTYGIVSQLGRTIQEATTNSFSIAGVIQFSAPINPGNSGGPLLDQNGNVIGITTATLNGSQGVGFAIPSSTILKELPTLIATGTYNKHSYLGISGADMNYQLAQDSNTNVTYGVLVESVVAGGPASKAGLTAGTKTVQVDGVQYLVGGDIIVSVNGTKIINQDALSTYLVQQTIAGQNIQVGIIRNGHPMTIGLTLGTRPAA